MGILIWPPNRDGDLTMAFLNPSISETPEGELMPAVCVTPEAAAKIAGILM